MNLKKFAALGIVGFCAIALSACVPSGSSNTSNSSSSQTPQSASSGSAQSVASVTITFADGVITPATATVKSGGTITWVNNGTSVVSVASDPHPTHTANPELTNGQSTLSIAPGASSTVTVTKTGTWGYHDHLKPSVKGSVTVK